MRKVVDSFLILVTAVTLPSLLKDPFPAFFEKWKYGIYIFSILVGILMVILSLTEINPGNSILYRIKHVIFGSKNISIYLMVGLILVFFMLIYEVILGPNGKVWLFAEQFALIWLLLSVIYVFFLAVRNELPFRQSSHLIIHFDGRRLKKGDIGGTNGRQYNKELKQEDGPISGGSLTVDDRLISVERLDDNGRFKLWAARYKYGRSEVDYIPVNPLIKGERHFQISCEVSSVQGYHHKLVFAFADRQTHAWVASSAADVTSNIWTPVELLLKTPSDSNLIFRIDDIEVAKFPSTIQIRNLKILENL